MQPFPGVHFVAVIRFQRPQKQSNLRTSELEYILEKFCILGKQLFKRRDVPVSPNPAPMLLSHNLCRLLSDV